MSQRQYFNLTISDLERIFDEKRNNRDVLASLVSELSHRSVSRAKKLQIRVLQALSVDSSRSTSATDNHSAEKTDLLLTVEEHRRVATHLRERSEDWTQDEQRIANEFAKHHDFLADLIEQRSPKS